MSTGTYFGNLTEHRVLILLLNPDLLPISGSNPIIERSFIVIMK